MQNSAQSSGTRPGAQGPRDLQATLYREIGISAVAAALRSINQPEPGKRETGTDAPRPAAERTVRAA